MKETRSKLFLSIFLIIIANVFLGFYITKDKIYSKFDLTEVSGSLIDFKFYERKSFNRELYDYTISLSNYPNSFQIIADFVERFNKSNFQQTIGFGDKLYLAISKKEYQNINHKRRIKIFGIRSETIIYMNVNDAIKEYNSQFPLFGIVALMIMGLIGTFHFGDRLNRLKKRTTANTAV
jgi:hypothetical protein